MKKNILLVVLFIVSTTTTYAQFEKGKWYINGSFTGINISHNGFIEDNFGLGLSVGNFLEDNFALIVNSEIAHYEKSLGAQVKYYLPNTGAFGGIGMEYKTIDYFDGGDKHITCFTPEIGYAFFLNKTVTIEPVIYYNYSLTKPSDYSKFGVKVGLGFYF